LKSLGSLITDPVQEGIEGRVAECGDEIEPYCRAVYCADSFLSKNCSPRHKDQSNDDAKKDPPDPITGTWAALPINSLRNLLAELGVDHTVWRDVESQRGRSASNDQPE
jgi:hypothetical protein